MENSAAAPAKDQIVDVRSVVEAVVAGGNDVDIDTPLYEVESLCMRCGENVRISLTKKKEKLFYNIGWKFVLCCYYIVWMFYFVLTPWFVCYS